MRRILLISRKYPPSIGGMQTYTKHLVERLKFSYSVETILLSRGQIHLFWFLPYAFIKSLFLSFFNKFEVIYSADALLAPLTLLLSRLLRSKTIVTVHGLDITYGNFLYQQIVPAAVAKFDRVVCVSRNTLEECVKRGIPRQKCKFIPNGIDFDYYYLGMNQLEARKNLQERTNLNLENKRILLTSGRLIKRKGVDWFIENVFINLDKSFVYIVCGAGPFNNDIKRLINKLSLSERVILLGRIEWDLLKLLYNAADLFIMPNQRVKDDFEGFGIVAIEASSCGLPVIANSVDGINDAVLEARTGWLIDYNNSKDFLNRIEKPGLNRSKIREETKVFSWDILSRRYEELINTI